MPSWMPPSQDMPSCGISDGQISALRSSQKPNTTIAATGPRIIGVRFGRCPSSTQNGMIQLQVHAASERCTYGSSSRERLKYQVSWRNCEPRRPWMNCVSSGRFPYQTTMYCAKKMYIQKTENAKIISPRSFIRGFVISSAQPGERRRSTQTSAVAATAFRKPPHPKYQPNIVEYQVGMSDITWS